MRKPPFMLPLIVWISRPVSVAGILAGAKLSVKQVPNSRCISLALINPI
jgi:hypothetical protein